VRRGHAALAFGLLVCLSSSVGAQADPSEHWRELRTAHFRIIFTPPLEDQARRAAVNAERAYAALARELVPPRGTIDVVLADNVDFTNGSATPFPTNRILLYAHPPVDVQTLRFYGDWNALVLQHELTHIFHLDRARGWWRVAQHVFGRNPLFMPNLYTPAWLTEGLAVYYESRLTGFGRLAGTAHTTIADAAARDSELPRLDEINLTSPVWPQAEGAYAYGSLLFEYLSRTRGPASIPRFIEQSSVQPIPFFLNHAAHKAFGVTFEHAWADFRDSLERTIATSPQSGPHLSLRPLTHEGYEALFPRWRDSTTLLYAANTEKDVPGLYRVDLAGAKRRLDRRNDATENAPVGERAVVYDQSDFTSPYDLRSDLYRNDQRLTHGARLSFPDVRPTGDSAIVAMQAIPAATRLVLVSADGRRITPLTRGSPDTQWTEPRWSPDGRHIAAVRWMRGGYTDVVVLDTTGAVVRVITHSRSVESSPTWTPDGRRILFTSDRTGHTELYQSTLADSMLVRLGGSGAAVYYPAVSPEGRMLAVSAYRGDGYHIAVAPLDTNGVAVLPDTVPDTVVVPPIERDSAPARRFRPWSGLIPRYWTPEIGQTDLGDIELGAFTSASDVVGQHAYSAQLLVDPTRVGEPEGTFDYTYSGIGNPILNADVSAYWTHQYLLNNSGATVAKLVHSTIAPSISTTFLRPRVRTNFTWSVGAEVQFRDYHTEPAPILSALPRFYRSRPIYPSLFTTVTWANTKYPGLAISPEDGISVSVTGQQQWQWFNGAATTRSVVGVLSAYEGLALPGFAHHVIAARLAAGWEDANATSEFGAGGRSGLAYSGFGDQPRVFYVRGYDPNSQEGTRVAVGSVEYRLPLFVPARGFHLFPVFLGRTSLTVFGDAGEAWCPSSPLPAACSPGDVQQHLLASVGGELNFDATIQYDIPYRLRLGLAAPVANRLRYGAPVVDPYVSLGLSF
jgi:WD40-like Beta Propeller Repeat